MSAIIYYDGPQLFLAQSATDLYLGLCIDDEKFLYTKVSEEWCEPMFSMQRDIRDTIAEAPSQEYFIHKCAITQINEKDLTRVTDISDYLPDEGLFVNFNNPRE